jgi:nicotinate-nucleotide pyrophosphorylase (carboxylating)
MDLPREVITRIVQDALREDVGNGDLSTLATIPVEAQTEAHVVAKEAGVIAGLPVLTATFLAVAPSLEVTPQVAEGDAVIPGAAIAHISGSARGILTAERVALNFIQRMSGIATMTARYVAAVTGLSVGILDTRKTTPGLRVLEKYAVRVGGGVTHRYGLYDAIMLKDNHLAILSAQGYDLPAAVQRARAAVGPMVRIEVEVESVEQAKLAAEAGADIILLDNMSIATLREAVDAVGGRAVLEASGGVTLETVRGIAETGVDYISSGALTHSVRVLDISLDIDTI